MTLQDLMRRTDARYYDPINNDPVSLCGDTEIGRLTPADLLGIIADAVSRLPHAGEGPGPSLELGCSAEAHALIRQMVLDGTAQGMSSEHMNSDALDYAAVRIGGLWVGASRPKTGGAT